MSERNVRLRVLLTEYQWLLTVGAVVLLVGGLWLTYGAYATEPETIQDDRIVSTWSVTGEFSHGATVEEENEIFPVGTELENEPLYYTTLSPTFDGEYAAGYERADGTDVTISVDVELVYRATSDGEEYWRESETVATATESDVAAGERVTAEFSLDVTELEDRIDEIEASLGASPGSPETLLSVDVRYDGTFEGESQNLTQSSEIDIDADQSTYRLEGGDFEDDIDVYETVFVEQPSDTAASVGGPAAVLGGAGALAGLLLFRHRDLEPTDAERKWLAYRRELGSFEELITRVRLPPEVLDRPRAEVASLRDLSEFAIDVESAIVEDEALGQYVVRHQDVCYVYTPPADPASESTTTARTSPRTGLESSVDPEDVEDPAVVAFEDDTDTESDTDTEAVEPADDETERPAGASER